jgi:hypothetical protein
MTPRMELTHVCGLVGFTTVRCFSGMWRVPANVLFRCHHRGPDHHIEDASRDLWPCICERTHSKDEFKHNLTSFVARHIANETPKLHEDGIPIGERLFLVHFSYSKIELTVLCHSLYHASRMMKRVCKIMVRFRPTSLYEQQWLI